MWKVHRSEMALCPQGKHKQGSLSGLEPISVCPSDRSQRYSGRSTLFLSTEQTDEIGNATSSIRGSSEAAVEVFLTPRQSPPRGHTFFKRIGKWFALGHSKTQHHGKESAPVKKRPSLFSCLESDTSSNRLGELGNATNEETHGIRQNMMTTRKQDPATTPETATKQDAVIYAAVAAEVWKERSIPEHAFMSAEAEQNDETILLAAADPRPRLHAADQATSIRKKKEGRHEKANLATSQEGEVAKGGREENGKNEDEEEHKDKAEEEHGQEDKEEKDLRMACRSLPSAPEHPQYDGMLKRTLRLFLRHLASSDEAAEVEGEES